METRVRGVRLPEPIWEALRAEAAAAQITPSELIRTILANYLRRTT